LVMSQLPHKAGVVSCQIIAYTKITVSQLKLIFSTCSCVLIIAT
jgi:hypothetical protein